MVVGMQHQQQQPHASPATVLEDATTPCVGSPPLNTPSTVDSVNGDVSDGSESSASSGSAVSAVVTSSMAVPAVVNSSLYSNNRVKLREVNPHLVCVLCHGYFVDATSIAECLHSFCRSCIILHLERECSCPICKVQINNSKPHLSLKPDKTLQDIVYKLVPGLFHAEMKRRNEYYQNYPDRDLHLHPEFRGITVDRLVYSPQDSICLSLEYYDKSKEKEWETIGSHRVNYNTTKLSANKINLDDDDVMPKKYFVCPAAVRVMYLKKLIRLKYNLEDEHKVELFYRRESLPDEYSLMDIAYIYAWKRNSPMRLYYRINILTTVTESADKIAKDTVEHNSSQLSPASEQEQAVVHNNNVEDFDNESQINLDAVKRPATPVSPNANVSESNADAQKDIKPAVTHDVKAETVEKRMPLSKPVTIISASAAKAAKSAASSMISTKATTKYKLISADKRDVKSPKPKISSSVSQPKMVPCESKPQTPIKSYLSISSILSDIDKSEVPKKPLVKTPCKSSDNDGTAQSNLEKPLVKPHLAKCTESIPKAFIDMVTVSVRQNKDKIPIAESTLLKTVTSNQSGVKTERAPCSGQTPVSMAVTIDGKKTPVPMATPSIPCGQKTPVTSIPASISNSGEKTPTVVSSTSATMVCGRKTPITTSALAQSSGDKIPAPVKSPSSQTSVTSKNVGSKTLGLVQNSSVKILAPTQSCGKKSPVPCQSSNVTAENPGNKTAVTSAPISSPQVKTSMSFSTSLPSPSTKISRFSSVPSSDAKTSTTSITLPSQDVKSTTLANTSNSSTNQSSTCVTSQSPDMKSTSKSATLPSSNVTLSTTVTLSSSGLRPISASVTLPSCSTPSMSTLVTASSSESKQTSSTITVPSNATLMSTSVTAPSSSVKPTPAVVTSPNFSSKLKFMSTAASSSGTKTSTLTSSSLQIHGARPTTPTSASSPNVRNMSPMVFTSVSSTSIKTPVTTTILSPAISTQMKNTIKSLITEAMASKTSTEFNPSKVSTVPSITSQLVTTTSVKTPTPNASNGHSAQKRASTAVTTSIKPTPIFSLATPSSTKPPPTLLPATSKSSMPANKTNSAASMSITPSLTKSNNSVMGATTSIAKSLSIPSSTSITVSSKSLPPPLITLTSTSTTPTLITSKELSASQYIPANTKIPSSLEISFTNSAGLTNGTPKSGHFIGKRPSTDESAKVAVKRAHSNDIKSSGESDKNESRQSKDSISTSSTGAPAKKIFTPNILPEVSITLNPHPEQNRRISPETSYDVSCFKPSNEAINGVPPLAPLTSPICKNIQNSPIKNLNNKKVSSGVRIVRNPPSMNMKLKHSLSPREMSNGEPEVKKPRLENGLQQQNGFFESMNGKDKLSSPVESNSATTSNNFNKTPSPTSGKKEARHQGIPKLIDIKAAPYNKLMAQDAKARLQFLKSALYVNPSMEPAPNAENALDLSSPSSKSPCSDKTDPSPEKKKLIPSVPPHMIPVTMAKSDTKSTTKTSPTLAKIERKPSPIAKLDKSPARKADFRLDNGSPSTPITRSPHSPIFSKTPSPIGSLHFSPPLNQALALNFLQHQQRQQYNRELVWLMDAYQNGQLPSHPLMHKNLKPPTPTSEAAFHIKK